MKLYSGSFVLNSLFGNGFYIMPQSQKNIFDYDRETNRQAN